MKSDRGKCCINMSVLFTMDRSVLCATDVCRVRLLCIFEILNTQLATLLHNVSYLQGSLPFLYLTPLKKMWTSWLIWTFKQEFGSLLSFFQFAHENHHFSLHKYIIGNIADL